MLDLMVTTLLSLFISNYQTKEHPYVTAFCKGLVLGFCTFIFIMIRDFLQGQEISLIDIVAILAICLGVGALGGLFFMFLETLEERHDQKEENQEESDKKEEK